MKRILAWLAIVALALVSAPVVAAPDVPVATVACTDRGDDGCCDKGLSDMSCSRCCIALPGQSSRAVPLRLSGGMVAAVVRRALPGRLVPPATPPPRRAA